MIRAAIAAAGLALAAGGADLAPARAESVRLEYEIRLGGFTAGVVDLSVQLESAHYRIAARTESRGLVDALIGFRSEARTEGTRVAATVSPNAHSADNRWLGEPRRVRIRWEPRGELQVEASPPPELDDRSPVPQDVLDGVLDPLSAALRAALEARAGRPCEGRLDVFDGRRRYALHFEARRREAEATHCRVRLERIAGMSNDPWLPILQPIETAELWIAPLRPELPPTPLKLQAHTAFGSAVVQLVRIDGAPF